MDISARALLVNTTVRVWTGEKRDRAITREICTMKGAEDNAVRANKSLLGEHIHGVQAAERAVRHAVNERTLPWMDDGTRILKGAVFMAFTEAMAEPIRQFDEAVDAFIIAYPEIKYEARRRLGDAYADSDFPPESRLKQRFGVKLTYLPVPSTEDFRVNLSEDEIAAVRRNAEEALRGTVNDALAFAARPPAGAGRAHGNAPAAVPPHLRGQGATPLPRQPGRERAGDRQARAGAEPHG